MTDLRRRLSCWGMFTLAVGLTAFPAVAQQTPGVFRQDLAWSPDGRWICYSSNETGRFQLYLMSVDGKSHRRLTTSNGNDLWASWSPDGGRIAFSSSRDSATDVYVIRRDGSGLVRLTRGPGNNQAPSWSHDGRRLAFATNRDGPWHIYVMDADGSHQSPVTRGAWNDGIPVFSPADDRIVFSSDSSHGGHDQVFVAHADGTGLLRLTTDTANNIFPGWLPDGRRVGFVSRRGTEVGLYTVDGAGGVAVPVGRGAPFFARWSSAGNRIAMIAGRWPGSQLALADGNGRIQRWLTLADSAAQRIWRDVTILGDDSLKGRGTPSPGLEAAARIVADRFRSLGLRPPPDSAGFVRHYPLQFAAVDSARASLAAVAPDVPLPWGAAAGLYFNHYGATDTTAEAVLISGTVHPRDSVPTAPLRGKAVILLSNRVPLNPVMGPNPPIILIVKPAADSEFRNLNRTFAAEPMELGVPAEKLRTGVRWSHGIFEVLASALSPIVAAAGINLDSVLAAPDTTLRITPLPGVRFRARLPRRIGRTGSAPQVLGVLPGSDPVLKSQYVVVSAHLDHLGVGVPDQRGDSVYNGADDDGSGVAALLEVARGMSRRGRPPRRSVLFYVTSGEERGFLGSEYFGNFPSVPLDAIVADINIDGIGKEWSSDTISANGVGQSTLRALFERLGAEQALTVIDNPPFVSRSDNYAFHRRGIPSVSLFSGGLFGYYHTPADEPSVVEPGWIARVSRLAQAAAQAIADDEQRPEINR